MKTIPKMAEDLNISSGTIREYLDRFNEFFPDAVENDGIKEYPPEAEELIQRIYKYYTESGMTKEEIRVKLGGAMEAEAYSGQPAAGAAAAAIDAEQFTRLTEKLDKLIEVIQALTGALQGTSLSAGPAASGGAAGSGHSKIKAVNEQITDILGMNQENDPDVIAQKVKEADGTVIFSYGRMSQEAVESVKACKDYKKPWIHIDLETEARPSITVRAWLRDNRVKTLYVAGRSASKIPGLKKSVNEMIASILDM